MALDTYAEVSDFLNPLDNVSLALKIAVEIAELSSLSRIHKHRVPIGIRYLLGYGCS